MIREGGHFQLRPIEGAMADGLGKRNRTGIILLTCIFWNPALAYAHGVDILLLPFSQFLLIIAFAVFLFFSRTPRKEKAVEAVCFSLAITSVWLLSFSYTDFLYHKAFHVLTFVGIPVAASLAVYLIFRLKRGKA